MKLRYAAPLLFAALIGQTDLQAQCGTGEVEVTIQIQTDNWGYELYWQLLPEGNTCGTGTIGSGGNTAVGCNGAGDQAQTPGGYGNNQTIMAGPWCLTEGAEYDLFWADDYADGGGIFTVFVGGAPIAEYTGTGGTATWTFTAETPDPYDVAVLSVKSFGATVDAPLIIKAEVMNMGSTTVNTLDLSYSMDGGAPVNVQIPALSIAPFATAIIEHPVTWSSSTAGYFDLVVSSGDINGNADPVTANNSADKLLSIWNPRPNIIDDYVNATPMFNVIANSSDLVNIPRDLDFYPDLNKNQLWVANKDTENSGGSTVTLYNAGTPEQDALWRRDGNAWHFMSLTTGLAFGTEEFFATAPGVFDANHNGAPPFTGPSLWSSDTVIYAQPSGANGSHMDMLHTSPHAQGIAHEVDNVYWVVDGYNNDVVRYDFQGDHGPGHDDHSDALIRRFAGMNIQRDPADHIVSHCDLDKESGWLYVVNHGQDKVFRLDINSGTLGGTPAFGPFEDYVEYRYIVNYTMEDVVTTGLVEPAGIVVMDDRMLVTDHATGDIIIYDITNMPATELGRISTGTPGIMGVTIGPDGAIWYVNATTEEVVRVGTGPVSVNEIEADNSLRVSPNPAKDQVLLSYSGEGQGTAQLVVTDATGRLVHDGRMSGAQQNLNVSGYPAGAYNVRLTFTSGDRVETRMIIVR
jgi:hypothetical protein